MTGFVTPEMSSILEMNSLAGVPKMPPAAH